MRTRRVGGAALGIVGLASLWWLAGGDPEAAPPQTPSTLAGVKGPRRTPASVSPSEELAEGPGVRRRTGGEARHRDGGGDREPEAPGTSGPEADGGRDAGADLDRLRAFLRSNAAAAERYVDRYCAETRRVAALRGYGETPRERDAAIYLAGRSDWEGGRIGLLHLPANLVQRMGTPERNWRNFTPADYQGLDFTWMQDLLQFDHWSLTAEGPLKNEDNLSYFEAPIPNFVTLQQWVKLRLVKGKNENDLPRASLEVRHLADLIASTGTLIGEMIRAAMYGIERGVWESAGLAPPDPPPTADDVLRIRYSSFAAVYFVYPGVSRAVREKALACTPARCSTVNEGLGAAASLRTIEPTAVDDLDWLRSQPGCEHELAERIARGPPAAPALVLGALGENAGVEHFMRLLTDGGID
jgi:hypothetical protein